MAKRNPKGTVLVRELRGMLRLYWSLDGKRYEFALGLAATEVNSKVAEMRSRQIDLDIASGNFDPFLAKYKPER